MTPHIMRHTFASLLASAGVSIYKIAKWLGDDVDMAAVMSRGKKVCTGEFFTVFYN